MELPPLTYPPVSMPSSEVDRLRAELHAAEARLASMAEQMVAAARRIAELEVERNRALAEAAALRHAA